jgi:hypothetical protein
MVFVAVRHARPEGIVFYQGVVIGFFTSLAQFVVERRRLLAFGEAAKNALLSFLLIYSFVFTVPTTVDRAYSVQMISQLGRSPEGLGRDQINSAFVQHFVTEGGVDRRLAEQMSTGSVRQRNGRYTLTGMGRVLSGIFRFTQAVFACPEKR